MKKYKRLFMMIEYLTFADILTTSPFDGGWDDFEDEDQFE